MAWRTPCGGVFVQVVSGAVELVTLRDKMVANDAEVEAAKEKLAAMAGEVSNNLGAGEASLAAQG